MTGAVRPPGLVYALEEWPPPARLALLALQYAVIDAIYLVLVTIIMRHAGLPPDRQADLLAVACLALAVGTVLQALPRGPIGSGFFAPPVCSATYLAPSVLAAEHGGMPLVIGMTIFAGLVEAAVGLGLRRLHIVITPVLSGLAVFVVGLQLGVVGIGEMLDVHHEDLPRFPLHLLVTIGTLAVCVGLSIWGRGTLKLLCSLLALAVGMALAWSVGLIGTGQIDALGQAPWLDLPRLPQLGYAFDPGLAPAFFASGLAAALRTVGVITTCQRINDASWRRPDLGTIRKGVLADGLANVVGGLLGTPGMSVSPSMVGISGATGATSRVIAFAAAGVLVALGLAPRVVGLFLVVPDEVAGSLLVFTASFMIAGGMSLMLSRPADTRATYVISISTLLALSENLFPGYFSHLSPTLRTLAASPLSLALTAAILLTLLFRLGASQRAEIRWGEGASTAMAVADFLRQRARSWKVPAETIETAAGHLDALVAYLTEQVATRAEGTLRLSCDGAELRLDIVYHGHPPASLPISHHDPAALETAFENEEAAAFVGLRDFMRGFTADQKKARLRRGRISVRLSYG
jgi:NCS2 family nucleobase:cation symporter-2